MKNLKYTYYCQLTPAEKYWYSFGIMKDMEKIGLSLEMDIWEFMEENEKNNPSMVNGSVEIYLKEYYEKTND